MDSELSKRDRKICEICIDKALMGELRAGLENFESIIQEWKSGKFPDERHAYATLYTAIKESEKDIFPRYNYGRQSEPLTLVAVGYRDGLLNDEDIKALSEEAKMKIMAWIKRSAD